MGDVKKLQKRERFPVSYRLRNKCQPTQPSIAVQMVQVNASGSFESRPRFVVGNRTTCNRHKKKTHVHYNRNPFYGDSLRCVTATPSFLSCESCEFMNFLNANGSRRLRCIENEDDDENSGPSVLPDEFCVRK